MASTKAIKDILVDLTRQTRYNEDCMSCSGYPQEQQSQILDIHAVSLFNNASIPNISFSSISRPIAASVRFFARSSQQVT